MRFTQLTGAIAGATLALATAAALFLGSALPLQAQAKPPAGRLYGTVQLDGSNAPDGTTVVAHVADQMCGQGAYDATRNLYIIDLDSSNATCAQMDATVWFSVGSCTAYSTGTVPEYSGAEEVDLQAPSTC